MKTVMTGFLVALVVLGVLPHAKAQTEAAATERHPSVPFPRKSTPPAIDRGVLRSQLSSKPITAILALRLADLDQAEALMKSLHTPGDPQYHQFLTPDQFSKRFGPSNADVAKILAHLAKLGLSAERSTATTLNVSGSPEAMERAFSVSLHSFDVPAHGKVSGYSYHSPLTRPNIPSELANSVTAVIGLDTRPHFRPLHDSSPQKLRRLPTKVTPKATGNPPGLLTVGDFAQLYDVQPLYDHGVTGNGRTLAIVTLASFTPADAFAYWNALGLSVSSNRLKVVDIDGGPGDPSDDSGSEETTLDVEQSGGIAPGAKIIVYQSPNTNQGFTDAFAKAIESNTAQSISTSWGFWEWYQNLENSPVDDPFTGRTVGITQAFHELFVRAALQGQSVFAASGDSGAYDVNGDLGCFPSTTPACSLTLSVDYPASDSAITAAGGTTLPGLQEFCLNAACTPPFLDINVPKERVWGWDYLEPLCAHLNLDPIDCGIFPAGTGGGVSFLFGEPLYQTLIPGTQRTQPGQKWVLGPGFDGLDPVTFNLPSRFPGRNVPDVSFNADPETGYVIVYTSDVDGPRVDAFFGGTSFVSPQLNGVTALLGQSLHGSRLGLLNYPLYALALTGQAYRGPRPPLHAVPDGNNWFYGGRNGYSPAVGLGTLDVANFAQILHNLF